MSTSTSEFLRSVILASTALAVECASASVVLMHAGGGETDFGSYKGFMDYGNFQDSAIHLAIAAAQSGDIVEIRNNDVWTHRNNNGYRINTDNITVRGGAGFNPVLRSTSAGTNALFFVNANGFTVQNLTFDNTPALHGLHFMELTNGINQPSQWLQTVDGLTIADVTMLGGRSAMRFGVGSRTMTNFTMVNNTMTNLRFGLGSIGVGFGGGTNVISGNNFDAVGLATAGDAALWFGQIAGMLEITNNTFRNFDGHYAIYGNQWPVGDLVISGNDFGTGIGGTGAPWNDFALDGGGHAVGFVPAPGAVALLWIGLFGSRRRR
jgi:MYXO-CTERM domain-containing protein